MTGRMIFDISDEDRARLEAFRSRMGLRSQAEALRLLINRSDDIKPASPTEVLMKQLRPQS